MRYVSRMNSPAESRTMTAPKAIAKLNGPSFPLRLFCAIGTIIGHKIHEPLKGGRNHNPQTFEFSIVPRKGFIWGHSAGKLWLECDIGKTSS